jgi:hypothetical protein
MAKTRGTGLLMVWTDIDPEHEAAYSRWYDEEHIRQVLAIRGSECRPLCRAKGQPKYLTLYEFANAQMSESEPWMRARDSNPWSNRIRPYVRHDVGSPGVYQRVFPK